MNAEQIIQTGRDAEAKIMAIARTRRPTEEETAEARRAYAAAAAVPKRCTYYGIITNAAGLLAEVECVREGASGSMRLVSQRETGVTYRSKRAANADNAQKNATTTRWEIL